MFKTCPRCGDEFLPQIETCPDCRVPLQHGPAAGPAASAEGARIDAPAPFTLEEAAKLRNGEPGELRQLAERLEEAGVACAVDTDPPGAAIAASTTRRGAAASRAAQLAIYVRERDLPAAVSIHQAWMAEGLSDAGAVGPIGAVSDCPGCGEPLADDAAACASCGLEFPEHDPG